MFPDKGFFTLMSGFKCISIFIKFGRYLCQGSMNLWFKKKFWQFSDLMGKYDNQGMPTVFFFYFLFQRIVNSFRTTIDEFPLPSLKKIKRVVARENPR